MLEHILNSIDYYFFKLKNQFKELKSYSYFTDDYIELISSIERYFNVFYDDFLKTSKNIREKAIKEEKKDITYFDEKEYKTAVKFYLDCFKTINILISNIREAKNIHFHQANFIFLEEFISENSRFIILPNRVYNYGYTNTPKLFANDIETYEKEIDYYDFFLIPYFNKEDIFNNTSLAHEIGHYVVEKYGLWSEIREDPDIIKFINEIIDRDIKNHYSVEELKDSMKKFKYRAKCQEDWKEKLKWINEILSDIIALKLFGLSYFFAYIEILFLSNPKSLGDKDHPPAWIRLHYMLNEIEKNIEGSITDLVYKDKSDNGNIIDDIGHKLKQIINFIKKNFSKKEKSNDSDKDLIELVYSDYIHKLLNSKIDKLIEEGKIEVYSYKLHNNEIIYLMNLLDEYITPNELIIDDKGHLSMFEDRDINLDNWSLRDISKPADIITILNAGWFYYLCRIGNHYKLFDIKETEYEEKSNTLQRLNNLVLKAIELSNIHKYAKEKLNERKNA